MASNTLRDIPIPKDASPGVQYSFRLLAQNLALTNQEITDIAASVDGGGGSTLAPTNSPTSTSKTIVTNEDASMDVILTWSYTQGDIPAEFFILFWKEGPAPLSALTTADNAVMVGVTARAFRWEGLNPNNNYRFGIAAGRQSPASTGVAVGTIVQPTSGGGSWADLTFGIPNYVGTIVGVEQHNWELTAAGAFASAGLIGQIGLTRDGLVQSWSAADEEFGDGTSVSFGYGLSYNLLVYDLALKSPLYAHCYDVLHYGGASVTNSDLIQGVTTGTGTATAGAAGKFGLGLMTNAVNSSNRAYFRTKAASSAYNSLMWAELWFKRSGNPASLGDILAVDTSATATFFQVPIFRLNTNGTVTSYCWDGAAYVAATSTATVTDGAYHWLLAVIGSGTLQLYIDGVVQVMSPTTATTFYQGAAAPLFLFLGTGGFDLVGAPCFYDELVMADNYVSAPLPTTEKSDYLAGAAGNFFIWHFQEATLTNDLCRARRADRALANVLSSYNELAAAGGAAGHYLLALHASSEPASGRLTNGLPAALATVGANRALFESAQFRAWSAYLLVGQPLLGEGNGIELYAGKIDSDPQAVVSCAFQTQGDKILTLSGAGWQASAAPGPPTNNPTPSSLTNTAVPETGQRLHKLTWTYTQPALLGDNKLADGFILYYQATNTANPTEQQINLAATVTAYTFQWSHTPGAHVSYAIASYRRTTSGVEVGPKQTIGAWQNVSADLSIQSFAPGLPTNNPVPFAVAVSTNNTGTELVAITWTYIQPPLTGNNLLADGFVVYAKTNAIASLADISNSPDATYKVSVDHASFTHEAPYGQVWSLAVAAYRKSINGMEIGPAQSSASAPDWTERGGNSQVSTTGVGDNAITTAKVLNDAITSLKLLNDAVTTTKRQNMGTQSFTTGTINANAGSNPVTFTFGSHTFTHSLGRVPTATGYAAAAFPCWAADRDSSTILISVSNLGLSSGAVTLSVDYW